VVAIVNDFGDNATFKHKLEIFSRYVKEKAVLNKLNHTIDPYLFPEDNEEGKYKTFILKCNTSDIKYIPLLKAICNIKSPDVLLQITDFLVEEPTAFTGNREIHLQMDNSDLIFSSLKESIQLKRVALRNGYHPFFND
jgi:hypothetical protein